MNWLFVLIQSFLSSGELFLAMAYHETMSNMTFAGLLAACLFCTLQTIYTIAMVVK